jgi:hypothetical protein
LSARTTTPSGADGAPGAATKGRAVKVTLAMAIRTVVNTLRT